MPCAVCGPATEFRVRYPQRIHAETLDFRARKAPSRQHFRVVECEGCGLVYSNPIAESSKIEALYSDSAFISEPQLENMRRDYERAVRRILPKLSRREAFLEIGCSNGFFLSSALAMGFSLVRGVEPSQHAVAQAAPSVRHLIDNRSFSGELFPPATFDLICGFQVLDHVIDPNEFVSAIHKLLRPGGLVLLLNHDIRSWFPRLLGERSPMYDVEHIYLFDKRTAVKLLNKHAFSQARARNISNRYSLSYAMKMLPFPPRLRRVLTRAIEGTAPAAWSIRLPAGNMVVTARSC